MAMLRYNPDDPQQFPLYKAESELDTAPEILHFRDKEAAKGFIKRVETSKEWKALGGKPGVKVVWTRHGSGVASCDQGKGQLNLPGWGYCTFVILHEMAHLITRDHHGPHFAGVSLLLYRKFIGPGFADRLMGLYDLHGVKYRRMRFRYPQAQRA